MWYLVKTPFWGRWLYPECVWSGDRSVKKIYLTFDDGPHPQVTPWVLDLLKQKECKATFFVIGKNAELYPEIIDRIVHEGHSIGNHTYSHKSGWRLDTQSYLKDIDEANTIYRSPYFRPPYGRMKPTQRRLIQQKYRIIMWDVLSGDFDPRVSPDACFSNVVKNVQNGSIVVFHDSLKAFDVLKNCLPDIVDDLLTKGFQMASID